MHDDPQELIAHALAELVHWSWSMRGTESATREAETLVCGKR